MVTPPPLTSEGQLLLAELLRKVVGELVGT